MIRPAYLILQDGSVFEGHAIGAEMDKTSGEVVFNTSMTGYQEILTDPSYAGQIVVPTYPLIGNYGINDQYMESSKAQVSGFVIREDCIEPSHHDSTRNLDQFLSLQGILGIAGVDTRAITKRIRSAGVMTGVITTSKPTDQSNYLENITSYDSIDFVNKVTTAKGYTWDSDTPQNGAGPLIVVVDCGVKYNILRMLTARGCSVEVVPSDSSAKDILRRRPDGLLFSPGPGDPVHNKQIVDTCASLIGEVPILGICLGHQIVAKSMGASTYKLKFGHRGGNHPVLDIETGRVHITAQNHGFAVGKSDLPDDLIITHKNLHDGTIEGLRHRTESIMTIQYHSEASPGPLENTYIFDQFVTMAITKVQS